MSLNMICDLVNPNDKQGRTFREINNATNHKFKLGDLVEIEHEARMFITKLTRDCDGTPLYNVGYIKGVSVSFGYAEEYLTLINTKTIEE